MSKINLSERIKKLRKEQGLTQKELAKKTGLSIASIQGYEQGKYTPKIEQLEKLAFALNASLYDLIQYTKANFTLVELKALKTAISNDPRSIQQLKNEQVLDDLENNYLSPEEWERKHRQNSFSLGEKEMIQITKSYSVLNQKGRGKLADYSEDLAKIPEYRKDPEEQP